MRTVLLVGATDGIGLALASRYLSQGWRIGLVGRSRTKLDRVTKGLREKYGRDRIADIQCDVTDESRVSEAFGRILRTLEGLDLMIYCAGVRKRGETPQERHSAAAEMLDVNLAGAIHFLELGAAHFIDKGRGHLAAIGSVAGDWARPRDPSYGASKAGLHSYLSGLRMRLRDAGVSVSTVKPGSVDTRMLSDDALGAIQPKDAARQIQRKLSAGREVFYVPGWWRVVSLGLRLMPRWVQRRVIQY